MELKRIADSRTPDAEKLIALHRETFPEYERFCDTPLMANMIDHERSMYFNAVYEKGELAGLFVYWDLGDSYYIHFIAVYPEKRNHKIGQHILDWVGEHLHRPVFLEAEIPYDAITARRLCFYKRNGFLELAENTGTLADHRRGGHPLWFMGTRAVENLENHLTQVRERVYYATGE